MQFNYPEENRKQWPSNTYSLGISGVEEPPGITAKRLSQPPVKNQHFLLKVVV